MAQPQIADGFADDCEELMIQCLKETPVTYPSFCKVFKGMQMSCVFHERQSGAEIAELSEELISIAKYHMVGNTSNFEASVVGVFLVYALVKLQPFENFAYLRITEEDVQYIERIELVARRQKRLDVLFTLGTLLCQHTQYCAAARERGMEISYRKYLENCTTDNLGQRPKGVFLRQNEELDLLKDLNELTMFYENEKAKVQEPSVPSMKYVDLKTTVEMTYSMNNVVAGILDEDDANDLEDEDEAQEDEEEEEIASRSARAIKEKAMKIKVDPIKHLIGVQDRAPPRIEKKPHVSDIKTTAGKIRTGEPNKKVHSSARRKKNNASLPNIRNKKRTRSSGSSDSNNEEETLQLSDHDSDGNNDIDLDSFNKEPTAGPEDTEPEAQIELEIDSDNIQLDKLPNLITSEDDGQIYEIEIIDQVQPPEHNREFTFETSDMKPEYLATIKNERLARKEKKDLKKPLMKSRFKRMGMEPIANFKAK